MRRTIMATEKNYSVPAKANQEFEEIISQLESDPASLSYNMKFNSFLNKLPYGTISDDDLNKFYERISNINSTNTTAFMYKLLRYKIDQMTAAQ